MLAKPKYMSKKITGIFVYEVIFYRKIILRQCFCKDCTLVNSNWILCAKKISYKFVWIDDTILSC